MTENQDMSQYLGIFMDEGREQLALLEQEILKMERGDHSTEILQSLFRAAHTLKGSSRTMGFMVIGDLTHEMENVLDDLRNDRIHVDTRVIDALLDCLDALSALMESVASFGNDTQSGRNDIPGLVATLESIRATVADSITEAANCPARHGAMDLTDVDPNALDLAGVNGASFFQIDVTVDPDCLMKAVRVFMVNELLRQLGTIIKVHPSEDELENDEFDGLAQALIASQHNADAILDAVSQISEISDCSVQPFSVAPAMKPDTATMDTVEMPVSAAAGPNLPARENRAEGGAVAAQTIRVGLDRLDSILNLVGELVIDRTQIARLTQIILDAQPGDSTVAQLTEAIGRVSRITSELQEQVMKTACSQSTEFPTLSANGPRSGSKNKEAG